jgi:hypothetical protein
MQITECRYILKKDAGTMRTVVREGNDKLVAYVTGVEVRDIIEATRARADSWAARLKESVADGTHSAAIHLDLRHGL